MTGKEVRDILNDNRINLTWLSQQLGISSQGLHSRLNALEFEKNYLVDINKIIGKDLFGINSEGEENIQPILDIRVCAGNGVLVEEGNENKVLEYVSIPTFTGCVGVNVYGESMYPAYKPGDVIFVRRITDKTDIDFGRPYLVVTTSDRLLKAIYESKLGSDFLRLSSFNMSVNEVGDRLYQDRDIRGENILYLYKVVGSLHCDQI